MQPKAQDWVPLFLAFVHARQTHYTADDTPAPDEQDEASDSESDSETNVDKQGEPDGDTATVLHTVVNPTAESAERQEGPVVADSLSRVGAKAWRAQLKEWLAFIGGVKGAAGGFRSEELRCCIVRQVQDTDSGVQQAALRCLKVSCRCLTLFLQFLLLCECMYDSCCLFLLSFSQSIRSAPCTLFCCVSSDCDS